MLKSTYMPAPALPPLPDGWTQHKAPDGRPYYYNDSTKQSTYTRPLQLQPRSQAFSEVPNGFPHQSHEYQTASHANTAIGSNAQFESSGNEQFRRSHQPSNTRGMRRDYDHLQRHRPRDRPKKAYPIPDCSPWLLVQTRVGRHFVHNTETRESLWKFPPDVLKAVVEYDRLKREVRLDKERGETNESEKALQGVSDGDAAAEDSTQNSAALPLADSEPQQRMVDSDGEEYEEVEVTDDEEADHRSKRQKTEEGDVGQPVEFNEDDIAYQLAAMGEDYGLDPGEYGGDEAGDYEEGAEGLPLTEEDSKALFKDMLSDFRVSPYTTWEKVIEAGHIIEDDRYTVLPNMKARKGVWDEWSRETIQESKERRMKEEKKDPKIPYFQFLEAFGTPKLYWPEFRRKYKKEPEMHSSNLSDKDREKWYREYVNRLKLPESKLKADVIALLRATSLQALNRSTNVGALPPTILTDLRFVSLRKSVRDPLIEAHIHTLAAAPSESDVEYDAQDQEKQNRSRREKALAERQARVQEEKRRQKGALQFSRRILRDEEQEVQRATNIGKEGLLGHLEQ